MSISVSMNVEVQTNLKLPDPNNSTDFEVYVREGIVLGESGTPPAGTINLKCLINVPAGKQLKNNAIAIIGDDSRNDNHRVSAGNFVPHRDINGNIVKVIDLSLTLANDSGASSRRVYSAEITIGDLPNIIHYLTFTDGADLTEKKKAVSVHTNIEPEKEESL